MNYLQKQYALSYSIQSLNGIKITKSGKNDNFEWGNSVTFRCTNIEQVETEADGIKYLEEKEDTTDFRISCDSLQQCAEINNLLREINKAGIVITLSGTKPRNFEGNPISSVTITMNFDNLFKYLSSLLNKTNNKAG